MSLGTILLIMGGVVIVAAILIGWFLYSGIVSHPWIK
jgi:hypothetical protein